MWMTTYWKGHHPTERKLLEQQRAQKYCSVYRNHREGWILNPSPPRINLVCFQGSIYPGETALWWCNQAPSPKSELELQNKTVLWLHADIYIFIEHWKHSSSTALTTKKDRWGGLVPRQFFFFQFSSMKQLYFSYSPSDCTVSWHSQDVYRNRAEEDHSEISWGPEDFPLREEFQCTCVLTVPVRLHLHCQRNIDPNTALTLPRHSPTKNIKAMPE